MESKKTKQAPLPGKDHTSTVLRAKSLNERPIKTNSRVQKDEKMKRDLYLAFVNNALKQKYEGNPEPFEELVGTFDFKSGSANTTTVAQLRLWISALSHVVSQLDSKHAALINAIVALPWSTLDATFVRSYISFMGILLSARPEYLATVLDSCVQGLTHQIESKAKYSSLAQSSSDAVTRRVVYDRHHALLRHLLDLIPTLPSSLQPLLAKHFPHKRLSQACQITYIRNVLRIVGYCPSLTERILSLVVERAIQIDVEIQVEIEVLEELQEANEAAGVFDIDPFDTDPIEEATDEPDSDDDGEIDNLSDISSEAETVDDDKPRKPKPSVVDYPHVQDMIAKLDSIMHILFQHLSTRKREVLPENRPGAPAIPLDQEFRLMTEEEAKKHQTSQFYVLLTIFDHIILKTLRSKYTQFLIFWHSSLDPHYLDVFQGMLISKAFLEPTTPMVLQMTSTSYIASLVSRANFVHRKHVRHIVHLFRQHVEHQLEECEADIGARPNASQYGSFYAVCQAMFLIFCFRWRDLIETGEQEDQEGEESNLASLGAAEMGTRNWVADLQILQRAVSSVLNPLKLCSSAVVLQFAKIAHTTGFLYVFPIIEANKRQEGTLNSSARNKNRYQPPSQLQSQKTPQREVYLDDESLTLNLNTFFPFDPYKLQQSSTWMDNIYREWSAVAIDVDSDSDSDGEDGDSDGEMQGGYEDGLGDRSSVGEREGASTPGLGASFEAMSISPARPGSSILSAVMGHRS